MLALTYVVVLSENAKYADIAKDSGVDSYPAEYKVDNVT